MRDGSGRGGRRSVARWLGRRGERPRRAPGRSAERGQAEPLIVCAANGCRFPAGRAATGDTVACPLCGARVVLGELFAARQVYVSRSRGPRRLSKRAIRRLFRRGAAVFVVGASFVVLWIWHVEIFEFAVDTARAALRAARPR